VNKATERATAEALSSTGEGLGARLLRFVRSNPEFQRFWKFAVVGAIGAVIDSGTFNGLLALGWLRGTRLVLPARLIVTEVGIAGAIAFTLAVISNFIWNRYWTYPDSRSKPVIVQLATFFIVNVAGLLIRIPILEIASEPLGRLMGMLAPSLGEATAIWLGKNSAWAIAVVIVMLWNFFVNRYWTYNDVA